MTLKTTLLRMSTISLLLSAAMAGEAGPSSIAPGGGVHAAGLPPAVATDKASLWEPVQMDLKAEATAQYQTLVVQIANRRWFQWDFVSKYAADSQALIHAKDRDPLDVVLRRTRALLADVKARGPRYDLSAAEAGLQAIEAKAQGLPAAEIPAIDVPAGRTRVAFAPPPPSGPRYDLFLELCAVRRKIALANPLLDFDQILFTRRARPHLESDGGSCAHGARKLHDV